MSVSCSIHKPVITSSNSRLNVVPLLRRLLKDTVYYAMGANSYYDAEDAFGLLALPQSRVYALESC